MTGTYTKSLSRSPSAFAEIFATESVRVAALSRTWRKSASDVAKLAPSRPMTHAIVLGAIGTAAALAGVIAEWKAGNQWYPIALVVLALPQSWLGGKLAARRS